MSPKANYTQAHKEAQAHLLVLNRQSMVLSIARFVSLLLVVVPLYFYLYSFDTKLLILMILGVVVFLSLLTRHATVKEKTKRTKKLNKLAENEIKFLEENYFPFPDGENFRSENDLFETDLDIFGDHSLYQYINRCQTYSGEKTLAQWMQKEVSIDRIKTRAESNKELRGRTDFRKYFWMYSSLTDLTEKNTRALAHWNNSEIIDLPKISKLAIYIVPALYLAALLIELVWHPFGGIFEVFKYGSGAMILMLLIQVKHIKLALKAGDKLAPRLKSLSEVWKLIEQEQFDSPELLQLQKSSTSTEVSASLARLSSIYSNLETINNPLGTFIINAFVPFQLFYYMQLVDWRKKNPSLLTDLPQRLGNWEAYLSLSQYSYNEIHNHYPSYDEEKAIKLEEARHPLMNSQNAISNSLDFEGNHFFILTGSNMSGKSTFLRTVGSIVVLGKLGTTVPAKKANLHNRPLYASMRVSDSLSDQSSYFHAELTKLKSIMDESENIPAFVLLDEILRGTNSEDKRTGTMDVIERFLEIGSIGIIATHDLEVCKLADRHPERVANICFESQVVQDDLIFDYKLRPGICENKNATFLMKKMGIIE